MSRSPQQLKPSLSNSARHLGFESPTRYDADFYLRKISRLQNDMNMLQDELSNARVRLRRAEDFELKFDMSARQQHQLSLENDRLNQQNQLLTVEIDKLRLQLHEQASKGEHPDVERLRQEVEHWRRKSEDAEQDGLDRLQKLGSLTVNHSDSKELEVLKRDLVEKEERYEGEIRQLNRLLTEMETVDKFVGAKVDRIRTEKDKEIQRLNGIIDKQKQELEVVVREKNDQLYRLRDRYEKIVNLELQSIHNNLSTQDQVFNIELGGLRAMIQAKNDEIASLLGRMQSLINEATTEKDELKRQIKALMEALYKSERESELEIYNIKERLTSIHATDLKQLQEKHDNHVTIFKENKSELQKLLGLKEEDLRNKEKEMDRQAEAFNKKMDFKDSQIKELTDRLAHHGQTNSKELHNLHQSLHQITSHKQQVSTGYLENIAFLDQQIKRLTTTLQIRNVEIKTLETNLADTKRRCDELVREAEQKWKGQRKEREQERDRLRQEKEEAEEEHRRKQQQWRLKEKAYLSVKEKDGVEIDRLNCLVTELQKDVNRLNSYIKQLDDLLKKQTRKSQLITLDTGGVRRELTVELDRQASELENLKRMELEQLRKKFELEVERLENDNRRLKSELLNRGIAFDTLEEEYRKIESNNKALERINKDKIIEYERKMASLNSEIYLTQNLYQSFMEAKSRLKKQLRP